MGGGEVGWVISVTGEIVELYRCDDVLEYLNNRLSEGYDPDEPWEYEAQQRRSLERMFDTAGQATAPLAASARSARGTFVLTGAEFDALRSVAKILRDATADVLIVDPYLDATALTDFAPNAPEGVRLRLLGDESGAKLASLRPAAQRWIAQYDAARPLEIRLGAARSLHDRLILIDGKAVWVLTQSLQDFAKRSPASVNPVDAEIALLKVAHYEAAWQSAAAL